MCFLTMYLGFETYSLRGRDATYVNITSIDFEVNLWNDLENIRLIYSDMSVVMCKVNCKQTATIIAQSASERRETHLLF